MGSEAVQRGVKSPDLNTTAYRIFKILQWLQQKPHSIQELNEAFNQDALIRKSLSTDSIWLYINTLRVLGCEISRPSPSNGFRHELLYHPFGIPVSEEEMQVLSEVKAVAEDHFSYQEVLSLNRFLSHVLARMFIPEKKRIQEVLVENYEQERHLDDPKIVELQEWIQQSKLLQVYYYSPVQGLEEIVILPEEIVCRRGVAYLKCNQLGHKDITALRLDRIDRINPVESRPDLYEQLLNNQWTVPKVVIRIYGSSPDNFESFFLGEEVNYFPATEHTEEYMEMTIMTRDFFLLKQKLLKCGERFSILEPESFREEMGGTLREMLGIYLNSNR